MLHKDYKPQGLVERNTCRGSQGDWREGERIVEVSGVSVIA